MLWQEHLSHTNKLPVLLGGEMQLEQATRKLRQIALRWWLTHHDSRWPWLLAALLALGTLWVGWYPVTADVRYLWQPSLRPSIPLPTTSKIATPQDSASSYPGRREAQKQLMLIEVLAEKHGLSPEHWAMTWHASNTGGLAYIEVALQTDGEDTKLRELLHEAEALVPNLLVSQISFRRLDGRLTNGVAKATMQIFFRDQQ